VRDGQVVIVDESTGRVKPISRYQAGIHQAIEAKEGVQVKPEARATASITFQVWGLGLGLGSCLRASALGPCLCSPFLVCAFLVRRA
jgi:hypothetical protein